MCKHILFNNFNADTDIETLHAFADETYDRDGFGAIMRLKGGEIHSFKSLSLTRFYCSIDRLLTTGQVETLVVHHRTSTNKDGLDYAHPFEYHGHYLTHNGVVQVPGEHSTNTENDSEALLHHLIKTDFETKSIQGYFSCFVLTESETIVLVDATAPMYSDGRVFSSHQLADDWQAIALRKITMNRDGQVLTDVPIEVTRSAYGQDKAHLSIGAEWNDTGPWEFTPNRYRERDSIDEFLSLVNPSEEQRIATAQNRSELIDRIERIADQLTLYLDKKEIEELAEYYMHYAS